MSDTDLQLDEKVADDGVSQAGDAVTPEGGDEKKKKGEAMDAVKESAEATEEVVEETVIEVDASIANMFEGMDLSEDFKNKVSLVFEAAVNEAATAKADEKVAEIQESLEKEMTEAVDTKVNSIVENLDSYLDYVVDEWMEENAIAIEAGIKVEMAESLMDGLRGLFEDHNIAVDEDTVDVVSGLEEQVAKMEEENNKAINENIALQKEIADFKAAKVFDEMAEGLTMTQKERLKVLAEKLDSADVEAYAANLTTLKESFFAEEKPVISEEVEEEDEIITEETEVKKPASDYASVNALVEALNARK